MSVRGMYGKQQKERAREREYKQETKRRRRFRSARRVVSCVGLVVRVPWVVVVPVLLRRRAVSAAAHDGHVVRRRRGLVQRLVRAVETHEARGRGPDLAVAQAAERDCGEEEYAKTDGETDHEREVRPDPVEDRAAWVPRLGRAPDFDEVGVRLRCVVRRGEKLDVWVGGFVCFAIDEVTKVDV